MKKGSLAFRAVSKVVLVSALSSCSWFSPPPRQEKQQQQPPVTTATPQPCSELTADVSPTLSDEAKGRWLQEANTYWKEVLAAYNVANRDAGKAWGKFEKLRSEWAKATPDTDNATAEPVQDVPALADVTVSLEREAVANLEKEIQQIARRLEERENRAIDKHMITQRRYVQVITKDWQEARYGENCASLPESDPDQQMRDREQASIALKQLFDEARGAYADKLDTEVDGWIAKKDTSKASFAQPDAAPSVTPTPTPSSDATPVPPPRWQDRMPTPSPSIVTPTPAGTPTVPTQAVPSPTPSVSPQGAASATPAPFATRVTATPSSSLRR